MISISCSVVAILIMLGNCTSHFTPSTSTCFFFLGVLAYIVFFTMYDLLTALSRGDDFPFQKIAFSVRENSEFRFKGLSKWIFCLAIDTVHIKFRLQKKYELRIRVLSKSHISKPLRHRLQDLPAGLISHVLCREYLAWIARCDDWTENWSTYVTIARVRLQQKYFCTHFLCAPQDWCKRSPLHCWNDIQCSDDSDPCPGHGNVTCTWQLHVACVGLYRSPILFNAWINATLFFFLWIWKDLLQISVQQVVKSTFPCFSVWKYVFRFQWLIPRFPSVFRDRGKSSSLFILPNKLNWLNWLINFVFALHSSAFKFWQFSLMLLVKKKIYSIRDLCSLARHSMCHIVHKADKRVKLDL